MLPCSLTLPNHWNWTAKLLKAGSQSVAPFDLELAILLPQTLGYGDSKSEPSDPAYVKDNTLTVVSSLPTGCLDL